MRMWLKTHAGEAEFTYERKPLMELERFKIICFLVGFVVWCATVCGVTVLGGFWFLVWFLCVTAVLVLVYTLSHLDI